MKIVNDFGDEYQASRVRVRMVKTFVVTVHLDNLGRLDGDEVSEEDLELIAHEDWLGAQDALLGTIVDRFSYIDIEFLSTDHIEIEVVE